MKQTFYESNYGNQVEIENCEINLYGANNRILLLSTLQKGCHKEKTVNRALFRKNKIIKYNYYSENVLILNQGTINITIEENEF